MPVSKSTLYYRKNKRARAVKDAYNTKYHATPSRKKYRSILNSVRRKRKLKGNGKDLSHTKDGRLILENRSKNRARNGAGGKSSLK